MFTVKWISYQHRTTSYSKSICLQHSTQFSLDILHDPGGRYDIVEQTGDMTLSTAIDSVTTGDYILESYDFQTMLYFNVIGVDLVYTVLWLSTVNLATVFHANSNNSHEAWNFNQEYLKIFPESESVISIKRRWELVCACKSIESTRQPGLYSRIRLFL